MKRREIDIILAEIRSAKEILTSHLYISWLVKPYHKGALLLLSQRLHGILEDVKIFGFSSGKLSFKMETLCLLLQSRFK